jgi:predicted AAA+ superfamily ATPase
MLSSRELGIKDQVELDRYLWRGGFPELWQRGDLDRTLWLSSYLATYLERGVSNLEMFGVYSAKNTFFIKDILTDAYNKLVISK